jgi:anaerobic dimethyl sulfoxide reductase subunit A
MKLNKLLNGVPEIPGLDKWTAALGGDSTLSNGVFHGLKQAPPPEPEKQKGKWVPANCWVDCGSKCFNKAYVEDGFLTRQGSDETHEDDPGFPQARSCARGRMRRHEVFGSDRLKYPMRRRNWKPGGGNKELRGRDEWVRISWEEALDSIAGEIKRITEQYGNTAIMLPAYVPSLFGQWDIGRTLSLYSGGFIENWGACSSGSWGMGGPIIGLKEDFNDRLDLHNSELIVLWGSNPAWSRAGLPTYNYVQMKEAGVRFMSVDPYYHPSATVLEADWIACRPATDQTLAMGMMHTLLVEDDPVKNPLIDWDFLHRCTVGFDPEHMPAGADPADNYRDYLLGKRDGIPKTAEWAAERCGVPPEQIRSFARLLATTERVAICMSPAPARNTRADSWPQTIMTLGAMTGHIGTTGNMTGSDAGHHWLMEGPPLVKGGTILGDPSIFSSGTMPHIPNQLGGPGGMYTQPKDPYIRLNNNELWEATLSGKYTAGYQDEREIDIQMIYHVHSNHINQAPGTMKAIEAHRKVEFVVTQNYVPTSTALYSDFVLPITTHWERYGDMTVGFREMMLWSSQLVEPMFEAQDDIWVARELGKRLGLDPDVIEPVSPKQHVFDIVAAAEAVADDGETWQPLVQVTKEDLEELGVEGKPQEGQVPIQQFKEEGIYHVPRKDGDKFSHIVLQQFYEDPDKYPLETASGKLEIHSQTLVDTVKACGWSEIDPIPTYAPPIEGYEDTFADWEKKVPGDHSLQFYDLHVNRQVHSSFANIPALLEAFTLDLIMNPLDAEKRKLQEGDTVLVESRHGKVLRPVHITAEIMPGVVALGQGAWVDIDEETGIDLGGSVNVLHGAIPSGTGHMGWNSCIVEVSKWEGKPLPPDYMKTQKVFHELEND